MSITTRKPNDPARSGLLRWHNSRCISSICQGRLIFTIIRTRKRCLVCNWTIRRWYSWLIVVFWLSIFQRTDNHCAFIIVRWWCDTVLFKIWWWPYHLSISSKSSTLCLNFIRLGSYLPQAGACYPLTSLQTYTYRLINWQLRQFFCSSVVMFLAAWRLFLSLCCTPSMQILLVVAAFCWRSVNTCEYDETSAKFSYVILDPDNSG